jgi:hypothetical protein
MTTAMRPKLIDGERTQADKPRDYVLCLDNITGSSWLIGSERVSAGRVLCVVRAGVCAKK